MGAASVRLRPTFQADLDWVMAAEAHPDNAPFVTQWTRPQHAAALRDPGSRHLIVESAPDGRRVGYLILAGLAPPARDLEVRRIVVTEKGRGYGRAALRAVKTWAWSEGGARRLWLDVRPNNPKAKRLYESEGFVVEATGPDGLIILSIIRKDGA